MDLRVLLSAVFLICVVGLPALRADDLSEIDSPMMDLIEEDGLGRMVRIDREIESDEFDPIGTSSEDFEPSDTEEEVLEDFNGDGTGLNREEVWE